jgi:hypothetical protein
MLRDNTNQEYKPIPKDNENNRFLHNYRAPSRLRFLSAFFRFLFFLLVNLMCCLCAKDVPHDSRRVLMRTMMVATTVGMAIDQLVKKRKVISIR